MTTFTDREYAIEAHHALLELAAFQERLREYKEIGLRVAARMGLQGSAARDFAVDLAERLAIRFVQEDVYARVAAELGRYGLDLSPADIRQLVLHANVERQTGKIVPPPRRSWIEFLVGQLLMLLGADVPPADGSGTQGQAKDKPFPASAH